MTMEKTDNQKENIRFTTNLLWIVVAMMAVFYVVRPFVGSNLGRQERALLASPDSVVRVLVVSSPEDSLVLRTPSRDLSRGTLRSADFSRLSEKLLATVRDSSQNGVGIAAPQIGLNLRVVAVQRLDKEGEPFEVYPNVRIDEYSEEVVRGREGCLSVPPYRGIVPRSSSVTVSYTDVSTMKRVSEKVEGFTAVIFQHECDHLDGILYTDKADTVFVVPSF